jgi:murein tripeptide amidase MpaA
VSRGFLGNWVYVFRVLGVACREEEKVLCFKNDQTKKKLRTLVANSQSFSLYLGNKTTFYFPIKKYPTIDSLTFLYIN